MPITAARVALSSTYAFEGGPDAARGAVRKHLLRTGLHLVDDGPAEVTATGGSQLVVRALGVWFAVPEAYPRQVRVTFTATAGGTRVHAAFEETLGFAYLDERSRRNYQAAFRTWIDGLGTALGQQQMAS